MGQSKHHKSSCIFVGRWTCCISPFSFASCNTWNFFDPRKVPQLRIDCKTPYSLSYTFWICHISWHYISCYIYSWPTCPRKGKNPTDKPGIHMLYNIDSNLKLHEVNSNDRHHNCFAYYGKDHDISYHLYYLEYKWQEAEL